MAAVMNLDGFPMFSEDLVERLVAHRRQMASLEAECTSLVAEMIRRGTQEDLGYRSLTSLLIDRLGVSAGLARGMIRTAVALTEMPHSRAALEAGDLDLPRIRLLVTARGANSHLFADHEQTLVEAVGGLSMADAHRAVEYWRQQAALEAVQDDADAQRDQRRLHVSMMAGMVHIDGLLDPVSGQVVMTALDSLTDPGNLDPSDERIPAQRRADALVNLCRDHLNHGELPTQRTERPHVMVHLSIDALEGRAGRPCELDDAGVITPRAARQLACDAKITRIITTGESQVLDVGRVTRVVSGGMRRALTARDGGCVIDGCGAPRRWCDAHHVKHWADGGPTSLDNLVLLCGRHHTLVHDGKVRIPSRE
ncbi:MAG: DUF222 domain-containing protein [Acidimicrobiia bacterium]